MLTIVHVNRTTNIQYKSKATWQVLVLKAYPCLLTHLLLMLAIYYLES